MDITIETTIMLILIFICSCLICITVCMCIDKVKKHIEKMILAQNDIIMTLSTDIDIKIQKCIDNIIINTNKNTNMICTSLGTSLGARINDSSIKIINKITNQFSYITNIEQLITYKTHLHNILEYLNNNDVDKLSLEIEKINTWLNSR